MELDVSSCLFSSGMTPLSDLFINNMDPTLSALNVDEDTDDGTQLMYHTDDLLSSAQVKFNNFTETCTIPLVTLPNKGIVLGNKHNIFTDLLDVNNSTPNTILIQTVETNNSHINIVAENNIPNDNVVVDITDAVICLNNVDFVIDESLVTDTDISEPCDQNIDNEDEITEALVSLGISKEYFVTNTDSQNSKKQHMWSCPIVKCNFTTVKLDTFKKHMLKHFDRKPFQCKHIGEDNVPCKRAFFYKSKLERHQAVHSKEMKYKCSYEKCQKMFSCKEYMKSHLATHYKALQRKCQIPNCNSKFNTEREWSLHMKQHSDVPGSHVCDHPGCGRSFHQVNALRAHQRVHLGDPEDLTCQLCGKQFRAACRLREHHNQVHEKIRKYKCTYNGCTWSFSTNSSFKRHMNKHLDVRNFPCPVVDCDKSFVRLDHLREHVRVHSNEKPKLTCPYETCLASFVAKSSLYGHLKHKHSNK